MFHNGMFLFLIGKVNTIKNLVLYRMDPEFLFLIGKVNTTRAEKEFIRNIIVFIPYRQSKYWSSVKTLLEEPLFLFLIGKVNTIYLVSALVAQAVSFYSL